MSTFYGCSYCGSPDTVEYQRDYLTPPITLCARCRVEWEPQKFCNECVETVEECVCARCRVCQGLPEECDCICDACEERLSECECVEVTRDGGVSRDAEAQTAAVGCSSGDGSR